MAARRVDGVGLVVLETAEALGRLVLGPSCILDVVFSVTYYHVVFHCVAYSLLPHRGMRQICIPHPCSTTVCGFVLVLNEVRVLGFPTAQCAAGTFKPLVGNHNCTACPLFLGHTV